MKTTWVAPLSILTVLLITLAAVVTPGGSTLAKWYDELTTDDLAATTDRYTFDFADVPSNSEKDNPASGQVFNHPGFTVTNHSTTLTRQMRITRAQLTSRYSYSDGSIDPIRSAKISYGLAPAGQTCEAPGREAVWTVKSAGQATAAGGVYTPPAGSAGFTLAPGETRQLCVDIDLSMASSTRAERRAVLLRFAGAGVKTATDVAAAQKLSTDGRESSQLTSTYRVGFPQPTPSTAISSSHGAKGCRLAEVTGFHGYMRLQWAWPNSATTSDAASAVVDHWELWSRPVDGAWAKVTDGNYVREGDWTSAPRYAGGNIPSGKREVFLERGHIRGPTFLLQHVYRDYVIVGVMKNSSQTRFVATELWNISWNGAASPLVRNSFNCYNTFAAPANLTGGPNMPSKEW